MKYSCVLWDFGDTLVDQSWLLEPPCDGINWESLFVEHIWNGEWGHRWFIGDLATEDVAQLLATVIDLDSDVILKHMIKRSKSITFFENAFNIAKSLNCPQAIVTVNSDIFSNVIVKEYSLHDYFTEIVTSWQESTIDKCRICDLALERLGITERSDALLIDNIKDNVDSWVALGGKGYHFCGDEMLVSDNILENMILDDHNEKGIGID